MAKKKMHHYTECGLPGVWLVNGFRPHRTPYGAAVIIDNVEGLNRAIGKDLIARKPYLSGAEFRFLRKELNLSQARLAAYFGNDPQSVALWEKESRVPKWADRFLRALYREHTEGNAHIQEIIDRLADTDEPNLDRRVFEERNGGWVPKAA